jgi:soluble lytic murein transglycosylase-like protein
LTLLDMLILCGRARALRHLALATLLGLGLAAPASAQIYSWRDANGHLVLSNHRPDFEVHTYAVPQANSVRATRPVAALPHAVYDELIVEHSRLNGIRTDLVRAVVQVESAYNPLAKSPKGAMGLMQLMPATMRRFGVMNAFNPMENIRAGCAYLRQLLDRYQHNEELALAAYNAGPAAVDRHGQNVPPYRETKDYVLRVNKAAGRPIQTPSRQIYKTTEIVNGRPVLSYSDRKPSGGGYEVVNR